MESRESTGQSKYYDFIFYLKLSNFNFDKFSFIYLKNKLWGRYCNAVRSVVDIFSTDSWLGMGVRHAVSFFNWMCAGMSTPMSLPQCFSHWCRFRCAAKHMVSRCVSLTLNQPRTAGTTAETEHKSVAVVSAILFDVSHFYVCSLLRSKEGRSVEVFGKLPLKILTKSISDDWGYS